ncbi:MAG TPA: 4a-hydroxytetrahydrobiopterin dehydratase [Nitrososphaerales archaeon]|nr:4a-hydroxytetrahydrobiopterin dehydratase [Nitrososphaerales archaeon]
MVPKLLNDAEVVKRLAALRGWKREGKFIAKSFEFETFMDGIRFLNRVARVAEELDHHPDIQVRYTQVRFSIQTHSEGGLTARDFELAKGIDGIVQ